MVAVVDVLGSDPVGVRAQTSGLDGALGDKAKYAAILCFHLPIGVVAQAACALSVYDVMGSVNGTFHYARDHGRCVEMDYLWNGPLVSWWSYSC